MLITGSDIFGQAVREYRKDKGWTQQDLAKRCKVGRRFIVDLEKGKGTCELDKAIYVAFCLNLRFEYEPKSK